MGTPTNKRTEDLRSLGKIKQIVVAGSFQPNAQSAPAAQLGLGTVSYSSTGLFSVVLPNGMPQLLGVQVTPQFATKGGVGTAGLKLEVGTVSVSTGTFQIRMMADGTTTLTDLAGAAGDRINYYLHFANTGVTR